MTDGVWLGSAEQIRWGPIQVEATVSDGVLVSVELVAAPGDSRSSMINGRADPTLEEEAVAEQGADLDTVSGATYTSRAYADSLQAALDAAAGDQATQDTTRGAEGRS